jgi:hypothetical protein
MTSSNISLWLQYVEWVLLYLLSSLKEAKVQLPSDEMIRYFQNVITSKYPTLVDCWGAIDGVKLPIQKARNELLQSYYYNGSHYVACLFLFTPNGHISQAYTNAPDGTRHDLMMAQWSKIYDAIDNVFDWLNGRAKFVVDSAFASDACPSLITSYQNLNDRRGFARQNWQLINEATLVHQMLEWGMRRFQSSFPHIKDQIQFEE